MVGFRNNCGLESWFYLSLFSFEVKICFCDNSDIPNRLETGRIARVSISLRHVRLLDVLRKFGSMVDNVI